ncbi:DUF2914 domain-containing protein [Candidatus Kaiserbacteria bacterium]|nr:DUF2914 domain-containing protein [Candidatus Kaiserbacteria bacterium]
MIRRYFPKNLEELIAWHERFTSPMSLVGGFLIDNFIVLKRIDLWQGNALLIFYLILAPSAFILLNAIEAGRVRDTRLLSVVPALPVAAQFAFGGLFSAFVSLYSRSAGFFGTWVFIAILACLLVGNERFRKLYMRFSVQVAMYFSALFLFLIFFLPVVFHQIGTLMFVMSGLVSIGGVALLLYALSRIAPEIERQERTKSARSIATIFFVLNLLYFTNIIPPLPLALKDAGVYHALTHMEDGGYELSGEVAPWYERILPVREVFHLTAGESVIVFTSIFAPTGLSTPVLHEWQHYDSASKKWITTNTVAFTINGGRDGGFRGYTQKSGLASGLWRVNVITPEGLIIGRVSFIVVDTSVPPTLETTVH